MSITILGTDHATLSAYGLDDQPEMETMEFRNERESGYGDDEGEWFATIANHETAFGRFHVLITGTHGNDHSPGASHYTTFTLFRSCDPAEFAEFQSEVDRLESMPERLDDETGDDDEPTDASEDD
jgi:hypothetical protein